MSRDPALDIGIFVSSDLDDLGLDVYERAVIMRIARRVGDADGEYFESVPSLAADLRMSEAKARYVLRDLERRGLITGEPRKGQTTRYRMRPKRVWARKPNADTPTRGVGVEASSEAATPPPGGVTTRTDTTPPPGSGVPHHQVVPTPPPGGAKGVPRSSSHEGVPLSLQASSETDARRSEAPAANAARESEHHPHEDGQAKGEGRQATVKGPHEGKGLAIPTDAGDALDAWNEARGNLPAAVRLTPKRERAWAKFHREHGDDALAVLADAARSCSGDAYWVREQLGFDKLVRDPDMALERAERWRNAPGMSAADRSSADIASRITNALDMFDERHEPEHAEDAEDAEDANTVTVEAAPRKPPTDPTPTAVTNYLGRPLRRDGRRALGSTAHHPEHGHVTITGHMAYGESVVTLEAGDAKRVTESDLLDEPQPEREPDHLEVEAEPPPAPAPPLTTNGQPRKPKPTEAERAQLEADRRELLRQQAASLEGRDP